jgi:16S rRNA (guanine1207-N2)-methyltransferase
MKSRRSSASRTSGSSSLNLKAYADRLVAAAGAELQGPDVLVILLQGTTLATALRGARPDLNYTFYTPEHFFLNTLQSFHSECRPEPPADGIAAGMAFIGTDPRTDQTIRLVCSTDPPVQEYDSVAFPTSATGNAEQTQELLQAAHLRLKSGGRLVVSTNNNKDQWLYDQLRMIFQKTTVRKHPEGVVYIAHKGPALKKVKDFHAASAFRFHGQLLHVVTLPGVFSHRRVDGGARALIHSLEQLLPEGNDRAETPFRPRRIADLGCGSGAVAIAAAVQYPEARVLAIDSYARAIECVRIGAAKNEIDRIDTLLTSDGVLPQPNSWDLILTNPPYYSDFRISELFIRSALAALRPGGRLHLVTKLTEWHEDRLSQLFRSVTATRIGEYDVVTARKF